MDSRDGDSISTRGVMHVSASTSTTLTGPPLRLRGRWPRGEVPPGALRVDERRGSGDDRMEERPDVTCVTTTGPGENVVSSSEGNRRARVSARRMAGRRQQEGRRRKATEINLGN